MQTLRKKIKIINKHEHKQKGYNKKIYDIK